MSQFTHHMMMIKSKNCEMKMGKKIDKTKQIKQTSDMSSSENKSGFFMTDFFFGTLLTGCTCRMIYKSIFSFSLSMMMMIMIIDGLFVCLFVCTSLSLHIYK